MGDDAAVTPALRGVRVIDRTDESAAFGTRLLADLGAEVIRVESSGGARIRTLAPFLHDEPGPERSLVHLHHDAGKRSVILDLEAGDAAGEDMRRWRDLVTTTDVLVETERLEHAPLQALNPSLLHITVTPFGLDGPWTGWRGSDLVAVASGGLAWVCGKPGDPPNQPGGDQAHKMAGLIAAAAAVIGIRGRDTIAGRPGAHIDISAQECAAMTVLQTSHPAFYEWFGNVPGRPGLTAVHKCADDRWTTLMVRPNRLDVFCDWCAAEGMEVPEDRRTLREEFGGERRLGLMIRELAGRYPRDEFMKRAWDLDLLGLPVNFLPDMETCVHFVETSQFVTVEDDARSLSLSFPRSAVDAVGGVEIGRAPLLGEHTDDVLASLPRSNDPAPTGALGGSLDLGRALEGVRVVDFCWVLAGPLGTRVLANFGAEVIRVEAGRRAFPDRLPAGHDDPSLGAFHNLVNTQKRSVTIDPRTARGRELLLELIADADVVTNNYRPGAFDEMGFGYHVLRRMNPGVILLQMPGCGSRGPWRDRGSMGNHVVAASGISALTGFPGRAPRGMGVAYPDFTTPYLVAIEVVAALRRRDRTGAGMEIELNQLAATVPLIGVEWLQYTTGGEDPAPRANRDLNWCPHGVYPAAGEDEWVAVAVESDEQWLSLCEILGRDGLAGAPRFASHAARKANEDEIDEIVAAWTRERDKWETADLLQGSGIAAAAVEHIGDMLDRDPYLGARHFQRVAQPCAPDVSIPVAGDPIQLASQRRRLRPAPMIGADNEYVLRDLLGLSADAVEMLRAEKVV